MKKRIVSGMRPTGALHIGHWQGALTNWLALQQQYECFFFVADWHALTTQYAEPEEIHAATFDMVCDWLAVGIDPAKTTLFVQSQVKQHAELFLLLSMIVPLGWLERNPTYKEQLRELSNREISTYGFLGYPVLQAADIVAYKASCVPVGEDQVPHLELAREIVRRFHHLYKTDIFVEPEALLTQTPKLVGTDGRKMSKSYNNSIFISETDVTTQQKIMQMITDPARITAKDPGHPDICSVFSLQCVFNSDGSEARSQACKKGEIGCVACKKELAERLNTLLAPIREKRAEITRDPSFVWDVLHKGSERARTICEGTMEEVRKAMKI